MYRDLDLDGLTLDRVMWHPVVYHTSTSAYKPII